MATDATKTTKGYRPPWIGSSFRPKSARRALPPNVLHKGKQLRPHIDFPPVNSWWTYDDTRYPYGCVCQIRPANGRFGSGVIIGPRHVLTASHVVDWSTDRAEEIVVNIRQSGATHSARAFDTLVYAFTHVVDDPAPSDQLDDDYAVLVTNKRIGDMFGWLGTKEYDSDWDGGRYWESIGYSANLWSPIYQELHSLDEDELDLGSGRAIRTSADIVGGLSGSPMYGYWADDPGIPYVVAVMSSDDPPENENWCAGGSNLVRLVNLARSEQP
jgi:V8-like Glu-specific endopeptidase